MKIHIWLFNLGGQKLRDWGEKKILFSGTEEIKSQEGSEASGTAWNEGFSAANTEVEGKEQGRRSRMKWMKEGEDESHRWNPKSGEMWKPAKFYFCMCSLQAWAVFSAGFRSFVVSWVYKPYIHIHIYIIYTDNVQIHIYKRSKNM